MDAPINRLEWPANLVDAAEVRAWVATALTTGTSRPSVTGPLDIYRLKDWGVTARFGLRSSPPRDIIFKACDLPIFAPPSLVHGALAATSPDQVPTLLAWTPHGEQTWSLFQPFSGSPLASSPAPTDLQDIARTMADLQVRVAPVLRRDQGTMDTPPVPLLRMFDEILNDIPDWHLANWFGPHALDGPHFGLPDDVLAILAAYRPRIASLAEELAAGGWPDSIDHVDLRVSNVRRLEDGRIFIFDWEEAVIGCPFFSLDRLLDEARSLDRPKSLGELQSRDWLAESADVTVDGTALCGGTHEQRVKRAYLEALPWRTREERERGFDLALSLAPIKFAYECKVFTQALAWDRWWSTLTAFCIARALQRWRSFDQKYHAV